MDTKPAATVHGTGSGEAKVGDRSLCATCGVLIIFGGTDPLYRHKHWVHVERENESDEREYVNCAVPDNPHYLIAVPTPPASQPTVETLQLLLEQSQKENALLYEELTQLKARFKELMNHLSSSGT